MLVLLFTACTGTEVAVCDADLPAEDCTRGMTDCYRCSTAYEVWYECGGWESSRVPIEDEVDAELERLCHCYAEPGECEYPNWM